MEKLERSIEYELAEFYIANSLGSQGILVEHSLIDAELQKDYVRRYFESKLKSSQS